MQYAFFGEAKTESLDRFAQLWARSSSRAGFNFGDGDPAEADLVLSLVEPGRSEAVPARCARHLRGRALRASREAGATRSLRVDYPLLVRALANIVLVYVPQTGVWFTTMERGHYGVEASNGDERSSPRTSSSGSLPLATSRLVIDNEFRTDLEPELWEGDEITQQVDPARAGVSATSTCSPRRSRSRTCSTSARSAT